MGYLDNLKKFDETGLKIWELLCADEVRSSFTITEKTNVKVGELSAKDAETIIGFVYDWVMNTEATAAELCEIIKSALEEGELTISDFENDYDACTDYINSSF